jgi:hypothetical protein
MTFPMVYFGGVCKALTKRPTVLITPAFYRYHKAAISSDRDPEHMMGTRGGQPSYCTHIELSRERVILDVGIGIDEGEVNIVPGALHDTEKTLSMDTLDSAENVGLVE